MNKILFGRQSLETMKELLDEGHDVLFGIDSYLDTTVKIDQPGKPEDMLVYQTAFAHDYQEILEDGCDFKDYIGWLNEAYEYFTFEITSYNDDMSKMGTIFIGFKFSFDFDD